MAPCPLLVPHGRPPTLGTWKVEAFQVGSILCAGRPAWQTFPGENPGAGPETQPPGGTGSDLGQMQLLGLGTATDAFGTRIPQSTRTSMDPGTQPRSPGARGQRWPRASGSASEAPPPQPRLLLTKGKSPAPARGPA